MSKSMSKSVSLRALVTERLTAAAEEIFALFERTIVEYEEELTRSKEENQRRQQLNPRVLLHRTDVKVSEQQIDHSSDSDSEEEWTAPISVSPAQIKTEAADQCPPVTEGSEKLSAKRCGQNHGNFTAVQKRKQCHLCYRRFMSATHLKRHMFTHTGERPFRCIVCHKGFIRKDQLVNHMRIHTNEKPFSIQPCTEELELNPDTRGRSDVNVSQQQIHHTDSEQEWTAPISASPVHMETEAADQCPPVTEGSEAPLVKSCKQNQKDSPSVLPLNRCQLCEYEFSTVTGLKRHMFTHTGERPFSCSVCHRGFIRKDQLVNHTLMHTGEMPFSCSVCNKKFRRNIVLRAHMKKH